MASGQGTYGQGPFGGTSFDTTGSTLVVIDPVNGATGISTTANVSFTITDPAEFDPWSLAVSVGGIAVIAAGGFLATFGGTVSFAGTQLDVLINTHPLWAAGANAVVISITDLAGVAATYNTTFSASAPTVDVADTVTVSDAAADVLHVYPTTAEIVTVADAAGLAATGLLGVADTVGVSDAVSAPIHHFVGVADSLAVTDAVLASGDVHVSETVPITEGLTLHHVGAIGVADTAFVGDQLGIGAGGIVAHNTDLRITFTTSLNIRGVTDPSNYTIRRGPGAFPIAILGITPVVATKTAGVNAAILAPQTVHIPSASFNPADVGDYLFLASVYNRTDYLRIVSIVNATTVTVDRPLLTSDPMNGSIPWSQTSGVLEIVFRTSKFTNNAAYTLDIQGLMIANTSEPYASSTDFTASASQPRVASVQGLAEGQLLVTFSDPMLDDRFLTSPSEYSVMGPTTVSVAGVDTVSPTSVVLRTHGMEAGAYTLTVNATGTPHDSSGNPIDPIFNAVVFTGSLPTTAQSIFVNKGPIARPPLMLQAGVGISISGPDTLTMTGGAFGQNLLGLYCTIGGTTKNDGTYKIVGVLANNKLKLKASFSLPDAGQLLATWSVFDPRSGEIADDPAHVTVRINGVPTRPTAVVGLLGQIVMPNPIAPTDTVSVDYDWVRNPTVEIRRINSREFRLNNWNRDQGRLHDPSGHKYRYNNVLPVPSNFTAPTPFQQGTNATVISATRIQLNDGYALPDYTGLNVVITAGLNAGIYDIVAVPNSTHVDVAGPLVVSAIPVPWTIGDTSDIQARLPQPLLRDLKYRAYERAYTACLNDPNTLRLNSPANRIAYAPLQRPVQSSFINYEPTGLPENDATAPWNRVGLGTVTVAADELTVGATATPVGNYVYWHRDVDQTFPHVFAATWRNVVSATPTTQGVWTGVAYGYSNDKKAIVIGYILDGTTAKVGFLKKGFGNDPSLITAWTGGLDVNNVSTNAPTTLDWTILHSFRIYEDASGVVKLYFDGEIVENMRITQDELPYLEELDAPFDSLQGSYFGHLSQTAVSTSTWDYVRYTVLPLNPLQTAPSIFVSYEGNVTPESSLNPWTPLGYHGTETILASSTLLLDSTSAVASPTEYIGGDFRGFTRLEPLLATDAEVVLDIDVQVRTWTHGISPNAIAAMIDDGSRLVQLSFLADVAAPKFSYGGNQLPTSLPAPWTLITTGAPTAAMVGRMLRVQNPAAPDGLLYIFDDVAPVVDPSRVVGTNDYMLEARLQPTAYTADAVTGFVGAVAEVYDSTKTLGFYLRDLAGVRSIVIFGINGFGVVTPVATIPFEWANGVPHTYRLVHAQGAALVTLFVDGVLAAVEPYGGFATPPASGVGYVSFGSSIAGSQAISTVDWDYCNAWRVGSATRHYVGIWKGQDATSFTGYHLPTKLTSRGALVVGNALADTNVNFITAGVASGDILVVDDGPNKGWYRISGAPAANTLTINVMWAQQPSSVTYRIIQETDWTQPHRYRITKDPAGSFVTVLLDADPAALIVVPYDNTMLPPSSVGLPRLISGTIPSFCWGAFDPQNLSQTNWDYVRFGVTRSPTELRIAPHHQVLNQRNVIASPEHLTTNIPHAHTDFWSSSTGIPPHTSPDFLQDPGLIAFTLLNEDTPLVPSTEAYEVRRPTPVQVFVGGLNDPAQVLNNNGFKLNEPGVEVKLIVPDDVLYSQLQVIEHDTGDQGLIAPFSDLEGPTFGPIFYQNVVCLTYDGTVLPENDVAAPTPWVFDATNPAHVTKSVFGGILTYGTDGVGTTSIYRNATPLPDALSLGFEVKFQLKVLSDGSGGLGDSQVRFGFSALGMTMALAFVTAPTGIRYVLCLDLVANIVVGGTPFDFYDGNQHTYRIVRAPGAVMLQIFIDS